MNKYLKTLSVAAGLMATLAFSNSAFAFDYKVFAGNACQINNPNATGLSYYSTGLYNAATFGQGITCPIVRDNSFNANGVWVRTAATKASFCFMDNTNLNGSLGTWVGVNSGVGVYGAWTLLPTTSAHTPYSLTCTLPAATRFTAYQTAEYNSTDLQ